MEQFHIGIFFVFALCIVGTFLLGRLFWSKSRRGAYTHLTNEVSSTSDSKIIYSTNKLAKVTVEVDKEIPAEVLSDMSKFYSDYQLENDLRILNESIDLMKTTKNIETFISRYDLAYRTVLTIEQAEKAGVRVYQNYTSSKELLNLKIDLLPEILNSSFIFMKQDAAKLKTEKGKMGRYQKYLELLEQYEYELDMSDVYYNVIELTRNEIQHPQIK